jgi:CheY-like chemotaxis protein
MPSVLIADDREENRYVLVNFFKLFGAKSDISIYEASSAKETIEKIINERPNLVFMDIRMETNDAGLDAVKIIRENPIIAETQIWAITAQTSDDDEFENYKDKCIKAGFNDYIAKPFDLIELLVKVSNFLKVDIPEETRKKIGLK